MKKIICACLCILLIAGLFTACGTNTGKFGHGKLQVVTTIFPVHDWGRQIAGDRAEVTMLLDSGTDLHSYQPTADDLVKLSQCDLFIYIGGESDAWAEDALQSAANENRVALSLLDTLGASAKEEEVKPGMQAEDEEEEGEEEGPEYDEHVWLSLKNAAMLCGKIADTLTKLDPSHAEVYASNVDAYASKLLALDAEYDKAAKAASVKTLLFGDRFPFRYLVDDYGLDYYAAFVGCSAETEASFETIIYLAGKVDELGLHTILQIESADGSIAETIRSNTQTKDQTILTLNSMQSVTAQDVADGAEYLQIMQDNLSVFTQALQ